MTFPSIRIWAILSGCMVLAGCATAPGKDDPSDPLESINRPIFEFNDTVDRAVVRPIAEMYVEVVPHPVRSCVSNFFGNLGDLWSSVNSFLQGRVPDGINSLGRVLMNTTIGGLGCFDRASEVGVAKIHNDFGVTLGVWGIGSGPYLVLPFIGPSSFRDGAGLAVDAYAGPVGQVREVRVRNSLWAVAGLNTRANLLQAGDMVDQLALDSYTFVRDAYLQRRQRLIAGDLEDLPDYSLPDYDDPEDDASDAESGADDEADAPAEKPAGTPVADNTRSTADVEGVRRAAGGARQPPDTAVSVIRQRASVN